MTPFLVVVDVLAEVPDGSVVGLGVEVDRDFEDAPVHVGDEVGDPRLDLPAVPLDEVGRRKLSHLEAELVATLRAELDHLAQLALREERVGDRGGIGERGLRPVDPRLARGGARGAARSEAAGRERRERRRDDHLADQATLRVSVVRSVEGGVHLGSFRGR
jgi:hypothetical protein